MSEPSRSQPQRDPAPLRPVRLEKPASLFPEPATPFLARETEIAAVRAMWRRDSARLITLVGPGGVGKTRLAIEIARAMAPALPDGARLVWLADVRDANLVPGAIARAGGAAADAAVAAFRDFEGLLVLDNFEHVVEAAPVVAALLEGCPDLSILVTSRSPLDLSAEHLYTVPPLSVPSSPERTDFERVREAPSVRLFMDRARARRHDFALTPDNAADIAAVCGAVDGLPLGIVLAAAHIDILSPDGLLGRLTQGLPLPRGAAADAPDRHRSMRNAIAWSHDLLDASAQRAFERLAVFIGGFTLDAAAAVIDPDDDPLAAIGMLAANSLLTMIETGDGSTRYTMLETIREYGLERLAASNDEAIARDRHAAYFQAVAEWSDWAFFMVPSDGGPRLARLDAETANIRAALGWLRQRGDHVALLRMASSLATLWIPLGHPREGREWIEPALGAGSDIPDAVRAKALAVLSWCVNTAGEPERAFPLAEASLVIWRRLDDPLGLCQALILSGVPAYRVPGHLRESEARLKEALAVLSNLVEPDWVPNARATVMCELGQLAMRTGDVVEAERWFREARDSESSSGYDVGESHIYGTVILFGLADIARMQGDAGTALALYQRGLASGRRYRNVRGTCQGLAGVAACLAALGRHSDAATIFGGCEALNDALGFEFWREVFNRQRALGLPEPWLGADASFGDFQRLRVTLIDAPPLEPIENPQAAADAWAEGRALPLTLVVSKALAAEPNPVASAAGTAPFRLSSREIEVLRLLVDGHTDSEIAGELFISRRTVATHIAHIYNKLGVSSRASAAAWAVRHGLA